MGRKGETSKRKATNRNGTGPTKRGRGRPRKVADSDESGSDANTGTEPRYNLRQSSASNGAGQTDTNSDSDGEASLPINLVELGLQRSKKAGARNEAAYRRAATAQGTMGRQVTLDDVGGADEGMRAAWDAVSMPLEYPEMFALLGQHAPRGVLFHGPPGTGKTLLVRALAHSTKGVAFFVRSGADCLSKWVGGAERRLHRLFAQARAYQPSVIFFDELDGLAPARGARVDQAHASAVATLLALMDGIDDRGQVVVIGATNRPDAIDPALRRPGRFDREVEFALPDAEARRRILAIHTRASRQPWPQALAAEVVAHTDGWSGADIASLCSRATRAAIDRCFPHIYTSVERVPVDPSRVRVGPADIRAALGAMRPSAAASAAIASLPAALPRHLRPLLSPACDRAAALLLDGSSGSLGSRVAVYGAPGMCVRAVGASVAHAATVRGMRIYEVRAVSIASTDVPVAAAIARVFDEARRSQKPSVVFVPMVAQLASVVGDAGIAVLCACIDDIAAVQSSRTSLLVTSEALALPPQCEDPLPDAIWTAAMPAFTWPWFARAPATARVLVSLPSVTQRRAFFEPSVPGTSSTLRRHTVSFNNLTGTALRAAARCPNTRHSMASTGEDGIPLVHSVAPVAVSNRSVAHARVHFVSRLMRATRGHSVQALDALRVRLRSASASSSCDLATLAILLRVLKAWEDDAVRDRYDFCTASELLSFDHAN
ncbi:TAT-binding protein-like protein 7, AAA ATPase [Coemansia sp. RSA 1813]|nr:TAT-binding protein-like protein 7, AAA ATPase [Coemansia sp. RSA 1646]KAJ1770472.1 TAT-binding protein-like protein 7, AAA ATPase [Coemansia sp. RSA 1843]KAJ2088171.1 TAT-binding protein-like protein 7, AAA ATPase [Coemansia sp. RSA 986]KAJ2212175.1 TAT-binding protein-like protein 7, AAA ATPase [Coemansia sp. RSA 487]KAJ2568015.1 TAT-binding protein-like protein 7, AAA ATPase [Coemansia sp. RSA 1813]